MLLTGTTATTSSPELSLGDQCLKDALRLGTDGVCNSFAVGARLALAELIPVHRVGYSLLFEKLDGWSQRLVLVPNG